jgi:hypothetical protein
MQQFRLIGPRHEEPIKLRRSGKRADCIRVTKVKRVKVDEYSDPFRPCPKVNAYTKWGRKRRHK